MKTIATRDLLLGQIAEDIIKEMEDAGLTADEKLAVIQTIKMRLKLNYYSNRNRDELS